MPFQTKHAGQTRPAFTLVEVLASISVLAILILLAFPGVKSLRGAADQMHCANNLRQIGWGLGAYLADNNGIYPRYYGNSYVQNEDGTFKQIGDIPWNALLINGGYVPERKTFICRTAHGTAPIMQVNLGNISYGINIALTFNYPDVTDWWGRPARAAEVSAKTIVVGDASLSGRGDDGYYYGSHYMYSYAYSGAGGGQAWPRHNGSCNILWGDNHVSAVRAPDPTDRKTLYNPEALGRTYDYPQHWLRTSSPLNY